MRRSVGVLVSLIALVALSGCGGDSSSSASSTTVAKPRSSQRVLAAYEPVGPNPSETAKMICDKEVQKGFAQVLDVRQKSVTTPTWVDDVYSCTYVYKNGSITLSVKQLPTAQATTKYFKGFERILGRVQTLEGVGQDAFVARNNDAVVRKDYMVLFVDVHAIPATFSPNMTRADVAINMASAIMGCWV